VETTRARASTAGFGTNGRGLPRQVRRASARTCVPDDRNGRVDATRAPDESKSMNTAPGHVDADFGGTVAESPNRADA